MAQSPEPTKKSNSEFPYEVFEPNVADEALAFYESTLAVFNPDSTGNYTAINKSIWIMEGTMNSFFGDSAYLNEDSVIMHENTYTFEINSTGIINSDIVAHFTSEYQELKTLLANNDDYTFGITDIKMDVLGSNEVKLIFSTHLLLNASSASSFAWPSVPPATVGRYAGASAECGSISGDGAWEHVQWQARQTLPSLFYPVNHNFRSPRFNVVYLNSDNGAMGVRRINGDWMLGWTNALVSSHQSPVPALTCVISAQQDTYSQKLSDELYSIVNKRGYWDGVSNLQVRNYGGNSVFWTFDAFLSKNITLNQTFLPCTIGVDC